MKIFIYFFVSTQVVRISRIHSVSSLFYYANRDTIPLKPHEPQFVMSEFIEKDFVWILNFNQTFHGFTKQNVLSFQLTFSKRQAYSNTTIESLDLIDIQNKN